MREATATVSEMKGNSRVREIGTTALAQASTAAAISMAEIDKQIATAHAFPRSITKFRQEALELVTLTQAIADECIYALPRGNKVIEGPSARFAEIIASCWGNSRAGARVMNEEGHFVIAQGVFHDLERNVAINYEVKRRITDRDGHMFNDDMIGVTSNAACSIALRNAILKGIPKAFWTDIYDAAQGVAAGSEQTLEKRRAEWIALFEKRGINRAQICRRLGVKGIPDIGLEHIVTLKGIANAIKNNEYTVEEAFSELGVDQSEQEGTVNQDELILKNSIAKLAAQLGMNPAQISMAVGQHSDDLPGLEKELQRRIEEQSATTAAQPTQQEQMQPQQQSQTTEAPKKEKGSKKFSF